MGEVEDETHQRHQAPICSPEDALTQQRDDDEAPQNSRCSDWTISVLHKIGEYLWDQITSHFGLFLLLILYTIIGGGIMLGMEQRFSGNSEVCVNFSAMEKEIAGVSSDAENAFNEYFLNRTMRALASASGVGVGEGAVGVGGGTTEAGAETVGLEDKAVKAGERTEVSGSKDHNEGPSITMAQLRGILKRYDQEKQRYERCSSVPDYWDWMLFCLTVYTTIGYGSIHPQSRPGRIVTMFYASFGIPLFFLTMGKMGKFATRKVKFVLAKIRKLFYQPQLEFLRNNKIVRKLRGKTDNPTPETVAMTVTIKRRVSKQGARPQVTSRPTSRQVSRQEGPGPMGGDTSYVSRPTSRQVSRLEGAGPMGGDNASYVLRPTSRQVSRLEGAALMAGDNTSYISYCIDDEFNLHPLIAIVITLIYILFGSFMYVLWEDDWYYYDAFYFIFISISTIGFGDVTPKHPKFFLLSSIYILFGLALVAMVIDVLIDFFTKTYEVVAETLPEILQSDDDSGSETGVRAGLQHLAEPFQKNKEGQEIADV